MKRNMGDSIGAGKLTLGEELPPMGGSYVLLRGGGGATMSRRQPAMGSATASGARSDEPIITRPRPGTQTP